MQLRKKTILIIGITLLCLIVILYTTSQFILIESFKQLEEQDTQKNIERARDALLDETNRLDSTAGDYAAWDDTYTYVQDGNEAFIEDNVIPSSLANLRINYMLFYNISGHLLSGMGIDNENNDVVDIPESFTYDSFANDILLKHTDVGSSTKGIIILPEGPVLIASRPVITSAREGPIMGTMIVGSFLDSVEIKRLSRITHLSLSYSRFDDPGTDFLLAIKKLSPEKPIFINPISNEIIAGYVLLNDIDGKPSIVLKAELPRGIHIQGQNTMNYLMVSIIVSGIIFGLMILWVLDSNVLSRLAFLSSKVSAIGASGNHSMRVSMTGKDELSTLSDGINGMLEELEKAEEENKKQLFLKEIYHRVKNNLQIVISLLNLQSQKTKDKKTIEIFKDSQNRIKSMALIHERLYKSKNLAGINFKEYANDLANNLFRSYGVPPGSINLKIDMEDFILNLDTATPCGLIITELISNSLKHAFPAGRKGEILIKFNSDNNKNLTLIVGDNGIGFPEEIDYKKTNTLGMQLVTSLASQLNGITERNRNNGTEFKITFKEKKSWEMENA